MTTTLKDLEKRLQETTGPVDGVTAAGVANSLSPWETESNEWWLLVKALQGSIDAALALVEAVLPGAEFSLTNLYGVAMAELPLNYTDGTVGAARLEHGNLALALCLALVRAKMEES